MAKCTAPVEGHQSKQAARACPECGTSSNPVTPVVATVASSVHYRQVRDDIWTLRYQNPEGDTETSFNTTIGYYDDIVDQVAKQTVTEGHPERFLPELQRRIAGLQDFLEPEDSSDWAKGEREAWQFVTELLNEY